MDMVNKAMRFRAFPLSAIAAIALAHPAWAQQTADEEASEARSDRGVTLAPYIEASQVLVAELSPGDDVVTYSQVAVGVDAAVTGRNNGGSLSLRYERNIGYGDEALDSDTVSGVARGYATVVPRALTIEGGALAARTRVNGNGGATLNPLVGDDRESRIYSAYAGPNLHTRAGDVGAGCGKMFPTSTSAWKIASPGPTFRFRSAAISPSSEVSDTRMSRFRAATRFAMPTATRCSAPMAAL